MRKPKGYVSEGVGVWERVPGTEELPDLRPERREVAWWDPSLGPSRGRFCPSHWDAQGLGLHLEKGPGQVMEPKPEPGAWPLPALGLGEGSRGGQPGPIHLSAPLWPPWGRWMGSAGQPQDGA